MIKGNILIVDDDAFVRNSLYEVLRLEGYDVNHAVDGLEAFEELKRTNYDVVLSDLKMPNLDGMGLLKRIKEHFNGIDVIIMTSFGSVENAVEAMKYGAADYITKPIIDDEIKITIRKLLTTKRLTQENTYLKRELELKQSAYHNIIGEDPKMRKIYSVIDIISNTTATVLIHGESGTGKGMVAKAIHSSDINRNDMPFIEVSCGALPETLLESELFGHVKGAFTSAIKDRLGRFELANGGTIFLDEIDTISPILQVKLLRVLQEKEFERVGDTVTKKVDVQIIAATNQNLEECIRNGSFREDLYYRLNVINIEVPPLRERKGDIPYLTEYFINVFNTRFGKSIKGLDRRVMDLFFEYQWPGNIRELENVLERAVVLAQTNTIVIEDLPKQLHLNSSQNSDYCSFVQGASLKDALKEPEKRIIRNTLESTNWNRKKTAALLDINRTTLYNKMKEYDLLNEPTPSKV